MASISFNFNGLHSIFKEAINRHELTIAFSLANGRGRFSFLIFIPTKKNGEIKWEALELFLVLGRTQAVRRFPLYGNHFNSGNFQIYLTPADQSAIYNELGLDEANPSGTTFNMKDFLSTLNSAIPTTLPLETKVATLKNNLNALRPIIPKHLDDATKIFLIGKKKLTPPFRPREETLRKLCYLDAEPKAIAALINRLKERNWTLCWTAEEPEDSGSAFDSLWSVAWS
ncbi:hypothetical protein [Chromobacterium amazonense]|uniref:Uncharacterized protein n=1 Tax=Chromobacterium amazonense TaxID=1382803 RepID=A0ABU8V6L5_9NEIS|nr:hypothetical protein [Chromobacterium amazonense]MDQ4540321.1 hypothetical protein [Chromobacterium amazonense]